jgi:hypothetical protein
VRWLIVVAALVLGMVLLWPSQGAGDPRSLSSFAAEGCNRPHVDCTPGGHLIRFRGRGAERWYHRYLAEHHRRRAVQRHLRHRWRPTVRYAIRLASDLFEVNYSAMWRVASCESGFDTWNVNPSSGAAGVFQFLASTFAGTPMRNFSVHDPIANSLAAAWLVRKDGGWREWVCRPG